MNKAKKTLPKGIIKRIDEINKLIKFAADNDIFAIEYSGTWESVYEFKPIEYKNQFVTIAYYEDYKNKLIKERYNINNIFETVSSQLTWVKRCIEKGIREYKKEEKRESLTGNNMKTIKTTNQKMSKAEAYAKAKEYGIKFTGDSDADCSLSDAVYLAKLAKITGYKKPSTGSGSTGRYFYEYLYKMFVKKTGKPAAKKTTTKKGLRGTAKEYVLFAYGYEHGEHKIKEFAAKTQAEAIQKAKEIFANYLGGMLEAKINPSSFQIRKVKAIAPIGKYNPKNITIVERKLFMVWGLLFEI